MNSFKPEVQGLSILDITAKVEELSGDVDAWCTARLGGFAGSKSDHVLIFKMAQALRSLVYFRAVKTLISAGLVEPAGAALRVLLEQSFVLGAIENDAQNLKSLISQSVREDEKALSALKMTSEEARPEFLSLEALDQARKELPDHESQGFDAQLWASRSNRLDDYHTMHRNLNPCSHGALGPLRAYLQAGDESKPAMITMNPLASRAPMYLLHSCCFILEAVQCLAPDEISASDKQMLTDFKLQIDALMPLAGDHFCRIELLTDRDDPVQ